MDSVYAEIFFWNLFIWKRKGEGIINEEIFYFWGTKLWQSARVDGRKAQKEFLQKKALVWGGYREAESQSLVPTLPGCLSERMFCSCERMWMAETVTRWLSCCVLVLLVFFIKRNLSCTLKNRWLGEHCSTSRRCTLVIFSDGEDALKTVFF
jgi:hypothetical protein